MKLPLLLSSSIVWASPGLNLNGMKLARFMYARIGEDGSAAFPLENLSTNWLRVDRSAVLEAAYNIVAKPIRLRLRDEPPVACTWATAFTVNSKGDLIVVFSDELRQCVMPYKDFVRYDLFDALELKTSYSLQLYEILKSCEARGLLQISVEQLRETFGLGDTYSMYADLKRKILTPAADEVSEKTDLAIQFHEIKEGKKVVSVHFEVMPKKNRQLTLGDVSRAVIDTSKQKMVRAGRAEGV